MTDLIPALETLIGPQPDLPQVEGTEAKNRFHYAFLRFMRAIAVPEHPLLIFLDDLQWADQASLDLLKLLMADAAAGQALLCIGAYRDNEVSPTHPLFIALENLQKLRGFTASQKRRTSPYTAMGALQVILGIRYRRELREKAIFEKEDQRYF